MKLDGRRSSNIEDQRGGGSGRGRGLALSGGTVLVIVVIGTLLGGDPIQILNSLVGGGNVPTAPSGSTSGPPSAEEEAVRDLLAVALADTEDTWNALFAARGGQYVEPKLVLFRDEVRSACGLQSAAVGPFYCPADQKAYLDLGFFEVMRSQFKASGDFAMAYVVAHEIGHHVQNLLGTSREVSGLRRAAGSKAESNALSVKLELQADCYAGVWANHAKNQRNRLEAGDLEEALNAASAIGDDTLQKRSRGKVMPETFTHGSAAQRVQWFRTGFSAGTIEACDTFQ